MKLKHLPPPIHDAQPQGSKSKNRQQQAARRIRAPGRLAPPPEFFMDEKEEPNTKSFEEALAKLSKTSFRNLSGEDEDDNNAEGDQVEDVTTKQPDDKEETKGTKINREITSSEFVKNV